MIAEKALLEESDENEIMRLAAGYADVKNFIENHEYEIAASMTQQDWLHIYAQAIKEHNLDFS